MHWTTNGCAPICVILRGLGQSCHDSEFGTPRITSQGSLYLTIAAEVFAVDGVIGAIGICRCYQRAHHVDGRVAV